jgi:hypothetical protein
MSYMAEELAATVRDAHGIEITGADIYALWEARTPWKKLSRERRDAIISVRRAYNKADREYWKQLEDNAFPGGCTRVLPSDFHS